MTFTLHMAAGVILIMIQTYIQLRFKFRNLNDLRFGEPQEIQELRQEIAVWQRAAASLSSYSKDEDIVRETLHKKVKRLSRQLKHRLASGSVPVEAYKQTLEEMQKRVGQMHLRTHKRNTFQFIHFHHPIVSNTKSIVAHQIHNCVDLRDWILLPAFNTPHSTAIPWLDGVAGRTASADIIRSP